MVDIIWMIYPIVLFDVLRFLSQWICECTHHCNTLSSTFLIVVVSTANVQQRIKPQQVSWCYQVGYDCSLNALFFAV